MKKIISLVLALVMVFAIAASASAITGQVWDKDESGYTGPYTITGFNLIKNPGVGAGLIYPDPASTDAAYISGTAIYFALYFTANKDSKIAMAAADYKEPWFAITATGGIVEWLPGYFNLYKVESNAVNLVNDAKDKFDYYNDNKSIVTLGYKETKTLKDYAPVGGSSDVKYMILGSGVVKGSSSNNLVAEIMGTTSIKFYGAVTSSKIKDVLDKGSAELATAKAIYDGKTRIYDVTMTGSTYTINKYKTSSTATDTDYTLKIETDKDKTKGGEDTNVVGIELVAGGKTYQVIDNGTYVGTESTVGLYFNYVEGGVIKSVKSGDSDFDGLKKKYDTIMNFFGFKFGQKGILLPIHFAAKFSDFYTKATDIKLNYSTTVPVNPDLELPPTGDAATSIGFVMIALAIVAASAVAYKKVRG